MKRSLAIGLPVVVALLAAHGDARASRLFFSTSADAPTEVAGQVNPSISVALNSTASLYLWWQPSGGDQLVGLGHSVDLSNPILTRASYTIDNPNISGNQRWDNPTDSGQTSANVIVQDAGAFNINGSNFGSAGASDPFFDPGSGAYRFSTLQFTATTAGSTDLKIAVGQQGIAFAGQPDATLVNFGFGDAGVAGNAFGAASTLADATVTVVAPDPAKPWQNPVNPLDVNGDNLVSPLDALVLINELNANGSHALTVPPPAVGGPPPYLDPTGDNNVQPVDVLQVINALNAAPGFGSAFGRSQVMKSAFAVDDSFSPALADASMSYATAVPEPSTAILALCGIALLLFGRRLRIGGRRCGS